MPVIKLPPQVEPLLTAWQAIVNAPPENALNPEQTIKDTIRLLTEMMGQPDLGPEVMDLQRQIAVVTEDAEMATTALRMELAQAKRNVATLLRALPAAADRADRPEKETVPIPEKVDGTRSKLRNFITQLMLRMATY